MLRMFNKIAKINQPISPKPLDKPAGPAIIVRSLVRSFVRSFVRNCYCLVKASLLVKSPNSLTDQFHETRKFFVKSIRFNHNRRPREMSLCGSPVTRNA
jgi:hypothetical protein